MPKPNSSPIAVTLENDLRASALRLPGLHRVSVFCLIRVGSRYETDADNGVSHLLEHMLYRGIPGYETAHEQALAFEALGGTLVATTGPDVGTLGISCPAENFEKTLALLGRVFREPTLRGLAVEKRIVREEILEDLDEDGTLVDDYDLLRAMAFSDHPLGLPVIGTTAHVERLRAAHLRRHHDAHYVGAGTVVAVAGPLDEEAALRAVERTFGRVRKGAPIAFSPPLPPTGPKFRYVETASSQTTLRVGFRGRGSTDAMNPATELVVRLLDDGNSTRLYTRLCDERGLAYDVTADHETTEDAGLLHIGCGSAHSEAPTVLSEIFDVIRSLRDDGPSRSELAKAKARHRWGMDELLDSPEDVAALLAELTLRGALCPIAERRARFDDVTRGEVRAAAARLFTRENLSVVAVGPRSSRARAALSRLVRAFD